MIDLAERMTQLTAWTARRWRDMHGLPIAAAVEVCRDECDALNGLTDDEAERIVRIGVCGMAAAVVKQTEVTT